MRIVITGSPMAGKTTMAGVVSRIMEIPVDHTDDYKDLEWSEASNAVSLLLERAQDWIIEGVTIPRALRKWRMRYPESQPPFDWFIIMPHPRQFLGGGQDTMRKQVCGLADTMREWIGPRWIEL